MKHKTKKTVNTNSNNNNNKTRKKCTDSLNKTVFYHSFEDSVSKEIEKRALINKKKDITYKDVLIKAFATPYAPTKYTPRSDYYTYINYVWVAEQTKMIKKVKKFYTQIDSFRLVQEKVYY